MIKLDLFGVSGRVSKKVKEARTMRTLATVVVSVVLVLCLISALVTAEAAPKPPAKPPAKPAPAPAVKPAPRPAILAPAAPKWNIGDSWKFRSEKNMGKTVTQNLGMFQIMMNLSRAETVTTYYVTSTETIDGENCYSLKVIGNQKINGTYSSTPVEGESLGGGLAQSSTFQGIEYRRISDLAFVKNVMHATGLIAIGGMVAGVPLPFESDSITIAKPPVIQLKFPLTTGETWHVSSTITSTTSGTTSDVVTITYSYDCKVLGPSVVIAGDGKKYESVAISQFGTQTTQSQTAGVSVEEVKGTMFYAPSIGRIVVDEAEGEELLEYVPAKPTKI